VDVLRAFVDRRCWKQADLARHIGITVPALRKHLIELSRLVPLDSTSEHPDVFWVLPRDWHPAGAIVKGSDVVTLVRMLGRTPRSAERDHIMGTLLQLDPRLPGPSKVHPRELSEEESKFLATVEDAASRQRPLRMKYLSARRGDASWRVASVARVIPGPPSRFLAMCHRSGELRSFRVGDIQSAHLDPNERFIEADATEVERRARESVDGWFDDKEGGLSFIVRTDAARWVARNLEVGMKGEPLNDGAIRVTASASGLATVARFVVGLGDKATCETPELQKAVRELALGALGADGAKTLHGRSVARIRAKG
jgi:predicted DNA-binding transcriptional regulator YafY